MAIQKPLLVFVRKNAPEDGSSQHSLPHKNKNVNHESMSEVFQIKYISLPSPIQNIGQTNAERADM